MFPRKDYPRNGETFYRKGRHPLLECTSKYVWLTDGSTNANVRLSWRSLCQQEMQQIHTWSQIDLVRFNWIGFMYLYKYIYIFQGKRFIIELIQMNQYIDIG